MSGCIKNTYKGDLRDFQMSIKTPMLKLRMREICKSDEKSNGPIMILGKAASGKSLLTSCIEGEMKKNGKTTIKITCEALMYRILDVIRSRNEVDKLSVEWSAYDVVIFDEIEELRGKECSQHEVALVVLGLIMRGTKVILLGLPDDDLYERLMLTLFTNRMTMIIFSVPYLNIMDR